MQHKGENRMPSIAMNNWSDLNSYKSTSAARHKWLILYWKSRRCIITARVRSTREGNVLTSVCPSIHPSVCPQRGVPISHNALQHFPECHEAAGGVPGPPPPPRGGTRVRYPPPPGGVPGPPPPGVPGSGTPPGGGTRVGQQKEYSLHGGRYASCVHAGGLSCL